MLSKNPNAIHILENNIDKINWQCLSTNPNAIRILEDNFDNIYWGLLSYNPNAIHILEKNINKPEVINNWKYFSENPLIFIYDKKKHFELIDEYYNSWI